MDVSWIPGSADLVVVIVAGLAVVGGAGAALAARRGRGAQPSPKRESGPASAAPTVTAGRADAPEAPGARLARLRARLSGGLGASLLAIFSKDSLSQDDWDELEETLLLADVGAAATDDILAGLRTRLRDEPDSDPRAILRAVLIETIDPALDRSLALGEPGGGAHEPIIVVGVNGVGKTTTVGKIARVLVAEGRTVVLGAADTFRAAAADQLETWGARVGVETVRSDRDGADPASVAFEAADRARAEGTDVLLIDTAGRLQNKAGLMDELGKIIRVVSKVAEPVEVLLVLDATTGQNGLAQARVFAEVANVTGIVLTKLDGTAKGGIVIAVQRELGVPVKLIGLGEGADDLAPFDTEQFVDGLLGAQA
ncbi:signal recognition particle-docking protein FtsY [Demequina activiva]|uniref:Signal recognition particle receptor FtsY n=1 Tax=Demequina activiva TaxID=1582364 RepID=A0A919UF99_9MICO|nr:signal recognition particle-docking protein FtsY [Demequina activiva]GIG53274.1 signal recognition particle receptor FtsY [Demequina activiva]